MVCPKCACDISLWEKEKQMAFEKHFGEYLKPYRTRAKIFGIVKGIAFMLLFCLVFGSDNLNPLETLASLNSAFTRGLTGKMFLKGVALLGISFIIVGGMGVFTPKSKEEKNLWRNFDPDRSLP